MATGNMYRKFVKFRRVVFETNIHTSRFSSSSDSETEPSGIFGIGY